MLPLRLLAVLSGTNSMDEQPNGGDHPLKYPFPDLDSSGCLMVHTLANARVEEIRKCMDSFWPDFLYLQGEQLPNDEVGSMVCAGAELSTPEAVCGLFGARIPTTVYLEIPNGEDIAKAVHNKEIPYVIYFAKTFTRFIACHFRHALFSVLQSSACNIWDAFMLAYASSRVYCVKDNDAIAPCFLGEPPKIDVKRNETAAGDDDYNSRIEIHNAEVSLRFLVCGVRCGLDSGFLPSLASGLSALLGIEIRGSKLHSRLSELPPPLPAGTFPRGAVTMQCNLLTTSSAYFWLLVSGSARTCLNEQVFENYLKSELIEKHQLVNADCEENKKCSSEARRSAAVAGGAPVFEVYMKAPKWASQVLRRLAQDGSRRGLVALGIAGVEGVAVASFGKDDAQRLLFFCNRQRKEPCSINYELVRFPSWLRPPVPSRNRFGSHEVAASISDKCLTSRNQAGDEREDEVSQDRVRMRKKLRLAAMRPVPHIRALRKFTDYLLSDAGKHDGTGGREAFLPMPSSKHASHESNDVANWKSTEGSFQAQLSVRLHSVKMKQHECGRSPIKICSEEEFLKDLMQFLVLQGHSKLIPRGGFSEFPATVLNKKRLDLFNMYKEVVSIGGFRVGDGINWKRRVFPKMRNHMITDTGLRSTLRRHYETYLLEYELAHDDVDGKRCLFCHSGAAVDWIKCGTCREWAHHGCDKRPRPVIRAFTDYEEGRREYTCPQCTIANFKKRIQKGKYAF